MAKNKNSTARRTGYLTPNQQWLGLTLLALLVVIAIFYFGVGFGDNPTGGHSG